MMGNYNGGSSETILKQSIKTCLQKADTAGYTSIAFPVLGAGGFGYPPALVIQRIEKECARYGGSSLRSAIIIAYSGDQNSINVSTL